MAAIQKLWNEILNVVFPPVCVSCGVKDKTLICENCSAKIEVHNSFFCGECSRRLPAQAGLLKTANLCHPEAKFVLAAAASYQDKAVRELIHALKYNRAKNALLPLGEIVKSYLQKVTGHSSLVISDFIIVPVPLHPRKVRERGFNQAELLAGIINNAVSAGKQELGITVQKDNLIRLKNTKSQTKMKENEERQINVNGAFRVEKPGEIAGRNIILVDDVFTSGATMREAVQTLKSAGAKKIIGFVIARA